MDCPNGDCSLAPTPVVPPWAQWLAFIAAIVVVVVLDARARREPGAALRAYIAVIITPT
jgi:hypothetical protein